IAMGKGDKKTRKGKIAIGSYGKKRPHDQKKDKPVATAPVKEEKAPAKEEKK
ncbi:MAG: ribosomal protein, partial [Mucilaginibacter sp.]|nr:ribosomal protein [Mucilaginibacter sp.]